MDSHSGLVLIRKKLADTRTNIEEEVAKGAVEDFATYKHMCGRIQGILYAEREILDMLERIEIS